jgi:hypothetical protein
MIEMIICNMGLLSVIGMLFIDRKQMVKEYDERNMMWTEERNQLLDRIQAGSFTEYKAAEIRMTKATNKERESKGDVMELL